MPRIPGLHHVTAICGSAQQNVDFWVGVMEQKFIKKTVNFDDPGTYHLYYGDAKGTPGTILTYFPFAGAQPGQTGPGMASAVAYEMPNDMIARIRSKFPEDQVRQEERFGNQVIILQDPDGGAVEMVPTDAPADGHRFHSVTLWERNPEPTIRLLCDVFGYRHIGEQKGDGFDRHRLETEDGGSTNLIDVVRSHVPASPRPGAGTIHHVAFRSKSPEEQAGWMDVLASAGHRTTPQIDRNYFRAIYFREPGGVLFEIATDPPGFSVDEPLSELGKSLKLPAQYESMRNRIEKVLPPLKVPR